MWRVNVQLIKGWLMGLDQRTYDSVIAALELLESNGPSLGRPLVDTVRGSRFHNMKELRPPSPGRSAVRILFAFDQNREAVLLVGGDKRSLWNDWYDKNIPKADLLWDQHIRDLADGN